MWTHPEAHPGEYLSRRYLLPLQLTPSELARRCGMPRSRVSDILLGKRGISADTAVRLGALFRMDPADWLALQAAWDLHQVSVDQAIAPLDPPGFLLGPLGATPLPPRRSEPTAVRAPATTAVRFAAEDRVPYGAGAEHQEVRYPDGTRALVVKP